MNIKTISEFLKYGKKLLKEKGIESFSLDANLLLSKATGLSKVQLVTNNNKELLPYEEKMYLDFLKRRLDFEPVAYILNNVEFMGLDFYVDKNVLIPRPDTETLVMEVIGFIKKNNYKSMLEIGSGSGCISISLNKLTDISALSCDISEKALMISNINNIKNNTKVLFKKSDIFENIYEKFDLIVSNPPYIKTSDLKLLDKNVIDFEPKTALDGFDDGLFFYREISKNAKKYLNENGMIFFEVGFDQAAEVKMILEKNNFKNIQIVKDLYGNNRVVFGMVV